jgi:ribosomal protein S18 acetylase RimI-like enzyme
VISVNASSIDPSVTTASIVRRAEIRDMEAICDAVFELTESSATAAHWSRAAYRVYWPTEMESVAMQAKALFVACVNTAAMGTSPILCEHSNAATERIAGFAAFSAITSIGMGECTLENMTVAEPWRRQGIGARLLSAGLLWCRAQTARIVLLEVRETNLAAIALYGRAGFSVVGRRPDYYHDPVEAALQMQKLMTPAAQGG